jgi:hypothetical protein
MVSRKIYYMINIVLNINIYYLTVEKLHEVNQL